MDESKAREILGGFINSDNTLGCESWHLDDEEISLEESLSYTADELEAIAWWMRNKGEKAESNGCKPRAPQGHLIYEGHAPLPKMLMRNKSSESTK